MKNKVFIIVSILVVTLLVSLGMQQDSIGRSYALLYWWYHGETLRIAALAIGGLVGFISTLAAIFNDEARRGALFILRCSWSLFVVGLLLPDEAATQGMRECLKETPFNTPVVIPPPRFDDKQPSIETNGQVYRYDMNTNTFRTAQ